MSVLCSIFIQEAEIATNHDWKLSNTFAMKLTKPSPIFWVFIVAFLLGSALLLIRETRTFSPGELNLPVLMGAITAYCDRQRERGLPVPAEITIDELVAQGFISSNDVSAFAGMKATLTLNADPKNLQQALMRVNLPDGTEISVLNDGSVQQRR